MLPIMDLYDAMQPSRALRRVILMWFIMCNKQCDRPEAAAAEPLLEDELGGALAAHEVADAAVDADVAELRHGLRGRRSYHNMT